MYISLYEISEKVCIVIEPKMDVNKLYIVKRELSDLCRTIYFYILSVTSGVTMVILVMELIILAIKESNLIIRINFVVIKRTKQTIAFKMASNI